MSGITPISVYRRPPSWDDCHCACAQERFYQEFGYDSLFWPRAIAAGWGKLSGALRRGRRTKPAPSCEIDKAAAKPLC